jgi:prevent-host-death family protein
MIKESTAMTVRQNLGELLNEVQYRRDRILITKAGKPVAALIDIETFDKIRKLDEEFDRLRDELAKAFERVPEADGTKLLDDAIRAARKKKAGRR